jgi:hypothetical protein
MNRRSRNRLLGVVRGASVAGVLLFSIAPAVFARHTLTAAEESVVTTWLTQHPGFRRATPRDCNCDEDIRNMRTGWGGVTPVPDYDPYRASGDFNGDGVGDIAVVLLDTRKQSDAFALLVFNGPLGKASQAALFKTGLDLKQEGLFYGPPLEKPYRLVLGRFYSDFAVILVPSGKTYRLRDY